MNLRKYTILLTGTIAPNLFSSNINVGLVDSNERLNQYENNIKDFITKTPFTDIVFIENSGYPFDGEKYSLLAKKYNKRFEFIYLNMTAFQKNEMIERGKSYGEALLIDYAMKNSVLIEDDDVIYKITGRIFLKNSKMIVKSKYRHGSEFIVVWPPTPNWVKTEFFKLRKKDYFDIFENSFDLCEDIKSNSGKCIERIWFNLAKNSNIKFDTFEFYPILSGTRGSSLCGEKYDETVWNIIKWNIKVWLGWTKIK